MNLTELQNEVSNWSLKNFGSHKEVSHQPLLGVVEEVGELCHAHLKNEQGIRTNEDHIEAKIDAIGDIVVFLADYCTTQDIDLSNAVACTWEKVKKRNWKEDAEKGTEKKRDILDVCDLPSCTICGSNSVLPRYQLQNRYQDGSWENVPRGKFECLSKAKSRASELCSNPISYGMTRVVDLINNKVLIEYPAGGF